MITYHENFYYNSTKNYDKNYCLVNNNKNIFSNVSFAFGTIEPSQKKLF